MTDLQRYLADHDAACPDCGYNLRALQSDLCPECGSAISLAELMNRPLPGVAYMFGVAGISLFMCWALLFSILMFLSQMQPIALLLLVSAAIPFSLWMRKETWIKTRPPLLRLLLALACWSWPLALAALNAIVPFPDH